MLTIILLIFGLSEVSLQATTYFVSPSGSDAGTRNGQSSSTAWRTIGYALTRIPSGNHVLEVTSGTYQETRRGTLLPDGLDIRGSGVDGAGQTKVIPQWVNNVNDFRLNTPSEKLFRIEGTQNHVISDIFFDGNNRAVSGVFYINQASNVQIINCDFNEFGSVPIQLDVVDSIRVSGCQFFESGYEEALVGSYGMINGYQVSNSEFSDLYFETTLSGTGMGIKAGEPGRVGFDPDDRNSRRNDGYWRDTSIHHCVFRLKPLQALDNGTRENFSMEFFTVELRRVDVYKNMTFNSVSVASPTQPVSSDTLNFYENYMEIRTDQFGLEIKTPGATCSNNYIRGGYSTFGDFTGNSDPVLENIDIRNNIAEQVGGRFYSLTGKHRNLKIDNNVVYFGTNNGTSISQNNVFLLVGSPTQEIKARNNILVAPASAQGRVYLEVDDGATNALEFSNNVMDNMIKVLPSVAIDTDNRTGDPGLNEVGARDGYYYQPKSAGSLAYTAGKDVGLPAIGLPEAGAFEFQPVRFSEAESADTISSGLSIRSVGATSYIGSADGGDFIMLGAVNFGLRPNSLRYRFAKNGGSSRGFDVRLDSPTGNLLASVNLNNTGGWTQFEEGEVQINPSNGFRAVYIVFKTGFGAGNFDWFELDREAVVREAESSLLGGAIASGRFVENIDRNDTLTFQDMVLPFGPSKVRIRVGAFGGDQFEIRAGTAFGNLLGTLNIGDTGGYQNFTEMSAVVDTSTVAGMETDIVLVAKGRSFGIANLDWVEFSRGFASVEAECFAEFSGINMTTSGNTTAVGSFDAGDFFRINDVDLSSTTTLATRYSRGISGTGQFEVRLGSVDGPVIADMSTSSTGGWSVFSTQTTSLPPTEGIHDIYIVGTNGFGICNLDRLEFR